MKPVQSNNLLAQYNITHISPPNSKPIDQYIEIDLSEPNIELLSALSAKNNKLPLSRNNNKYRPELLHVLSSIKHHKNGSDDIFSQKPLNRKSMKAAFKAALTENGYSLRGAAKALGVPLSVLSSINSESATIDKTNEVISMLGYEATLTFRPKKSDQRS